MARTAYPTGGRKPTAPSGGARARSDSRRPPRPYDFLGMAKDKIPTSRARRTARVGGLAAGQAMRQAGTRMANVARSQQGRTRALERRHIETAEQIVTALGTMKGAAMKLGQVMSFLDVGLVPEEYREEFQRKLGELRDAAPNVRFEDMRKVIEQELDDPVEELFEDFQEEPIAAASIGQVYRARLPDGRDVAVKVQYPRVAEAVRADMANLGLILRLLKRLAPGLDVRALSDEVRRRINEELDYELEAQNQRALARIYRGHPFIFVPQVVTRLSRERVMVSEYVEGTGFEELKGYPDADRDRLGEVIFRFYCGCLYRHHQFSGDPHPGNFLLMEDARVAFLDFGLFKRMQSEPVELELACQRAVVEDDREQLHRLLAEGGFLPRPERVDTDHLMAYVRDAIWWYTTDEEIELTPEIATTVLIESSDPRSTHYREMRHQDMRPEHLFGRRMEMLTLAVLSQLRASANWHRIAREWMYGDEPVTGLGRAEAEFYAGVAPA
jgi:predicted unusual protein kinase regulating ubiquinone biosynthesis (AarF/ABC1/UbiB family)